MTEPKASPEIKKRKQALHEEEKKLLLGLVDSKKNIIQCRESKADINKQKKASWVKVRT